MSLGDVHTSIGCVHAHQTVLWVSVILIPVGNCATVNTQSYIRVPEWPVTVASRPTGTCLPATKSKYNCDESSENSSASEPHKITVPVHEETPYRKNGRSIPC